MTTKATCDRRDVLAAFGALSGVLLIAGPAALIADPSASAAPAGPAPADPAGSLALTTLSSAEGVCILSVARTLAPHDTLEDAAYALVVQAIDAAVRADDSRRLAVRSGLERLGETFPALPEAQRVAALGALESSAFFGFVRATTLATLYASPLAYAHFGYEGEAFSKGGYLFRGFDALDWLPEVPLEDSGPNPAAPGRRG